MLPWEDHLIGFTWTRPSQASVLSELTFASDFGFCFQCKVGWGLVLRRPIETTRLTRHNLNPARQAAKFYRDLKQRGPIPTKRTAKIIELSMGVKTRVSKRMARIRHALTKNILAVFLFMSSP